MKTSEFQILWQLVVPCSTLFKEREWEREKEREREREREREKPFYARDKCTGDQKE